MSDGQSEGHKHYLREQAHAMTAPDEHEALVEAVAPLFCCPAGCACPVDCGSGSYKREARAVLALVAERRKPEVSAARRAAIDECERIARGRLMKGSVRYREPVDEPNGRDWGPDSEYGRGRHDAADAIARMVPTAGD